MDSFYKQISKDVQNYDGKHSKAIKLTPSIYKLLCQLFTESKFDSKTRANILTVIGYYVIPDDILNENILGPIGYIDDFLLSTSILKKIEIDYDHESIAQHWNNSIELKTVLNDYFEEIKSEYIYEYSKIKELLPDLFTYN